MIPQPHVVILDEIELHPWIQEAPVLRHDARTAPGDRVEVMLIVSEAAAPAAHPALVHSGRVAAVELPAVVLVAEFVDDLTAVVEVIVLQVVDTVNARRPAGVERVERLDTSRR